MGSSSVLMFGSYYSDNIRQNQGITVSWVCLWFLHERTMHVYKFIEATQLSTVESVCCGLPTATMDTPATLWKCPTSQPPTTEARQPTTEAHQHWEHFSASRSMLGYTKSLKLSLPSCKIAHGVCINQKQVTCEHNWIGTNVGMLIHLFRP